MEASKNDPLHEVLNKYAVPDPKIVGKLPRGGQQLDFVGHADICRILITIDPHWRLVPIAWENGRPAMNIVNDMATMWFELTLLGTPRLAIGSAKANTPDLDKILYGDALRNGAMRFGISLSLWTKQEWEDLNTHPDPAPVRPKVAPVTPDTPLQKTQINQFVKACEKANIKAEEVAARSNVELAKATHGDLEKLRATYKEMIAELANNPKED